MKSTYRRAATKVRGPGAPRHVWLKLTEAARLIAGRAESTVWGAARGGLIEDMTQMRRGVKPSDFPVPHASARAMAEAFVRVIDAFSIASPEARLDYAPALAATAKVLSDLLEAQRADQARDSWMRQMPASEQL